MADRNKIIEMIAKMSRLTEDVGAFQNEASVAAAKIQELMEKYAISQMDVQNFIADKQEKEYKIAFESKMSEFRHKAIQEWEWSLARVIADVTMTRHYSLGGRFVFFGVPENAEAAVYLYTLWHSNIETMAEKARWENVLALRKKYGKRPALRHWIQENHPEDDPKYFRPSWIRGCLHAMAMNVYNERKAREEAIEVDALPPGEKVQAQANASAIVLYKAEVDKAYEVLSKGFKTINTKGSSGWSSAGYIQGKETGSKIKIGSKELGGK